MKDLKKISARIANEDNDGNQKLRGEEMTKGDKSMDQCKSISWSNMYKLVLLRENYMNLREDHQYQNRHYTFDCVFYIG